MENMKKKVEEKYSRKLEMENKRYARMVAQHPQTIQQIKNNCQRELHEILALKELFMENLSEGNFSTHYGKYSETLKIGELPLFYECLREMKQENSLFSTDELTFNLCPCKEIDDETIKTLCKTLKEIGLKIRRLSFSGFGSGSSNNEKITFEGGLTYLKNFERLDLSRCSNLDNEGLKSIIKNNPGLKRLSLLHCDKIDDKGLLQLTECKNLEYLTAITDDIKKKEICYYVLEDQKEIQEFLTTLKSKLNESKVKKEKNPTCRCIQM